MPRNNKVKNFDKVICIRIPRQVWKEACWHARGGEGRKITGGRKITFSQYCRMALETQNLIDTELTEQQVKAWRAGKITVKPMFVEVEPIKTKEVISDAEQETTVRQGKAEVVVTAAEIGEVEDEKPELIEATVEPPRPIKALDEQIYGGN